MITVLHMDGLANGYSMYGGRGPLQMITVLHRGGSSQMITVLQRGAPPNDYYIN